MDLRLVAQLAGGRQRDIHVVADDDATIANLSRQIAARTGVPSGGSIRIHAVRQDRDLDEGETIASVGFRQGDRLRIGSAASPRPDGGRGAAAVRVLEILSGPSAGRTFPLPAGDHILGRDGAKAGLVLEDASVSSRHLAIRLRDDTVLVRDLGSRNGTLVDGVALPPGERRQIADAELVQVGRSLVRFARTRPTIDARRADADGTIAFNRPPRVAVEPAAPFPTIEVPAGPTAVHRLSLAIWLLPLIAGLVLGALGNLAMLVFSALSPIIAVMTYWFDRRNSRSEYRKRSAEFRARLEELRATTLAAREVEVADRRRENPDAAALLRRATSHDSSLWDRRPADADFAQVRIGSGTQPSRRPLHVADGGSDELREEAIATIEGLADVRAVPVVIGAREAGGIGLIGPAESISAVGRWIALQMAILHSPRDVVVLAAIDPAHVPDWECLKWLPHSRSETSPVRGRHLVADRRSADALLAAVADLARQRAASVDRLGSASPAGPFVLLIVDEALGVNPAIASALLSDAPRANVAVLWLGSERTRLPGECTRIVELDPSVWRLVLTETTTGRITPDVIAEGVATDVALDAALALAPLRDIGAPGAGSELPTKLALLSLIGRDASSAAQVAAAWHGRHDDLAAVIGEGRSGAVAVDIRRDGPHGLVAGTTGAGKSELLQTLVASLAARHSPRELTFLLVDYKGGAAFRECARLPHTVGLVTDLDAHLARRVLDSLNAEIRRREEIVRDHGVKDLVTLAANDAAAAPPSLMILVDEFATLAAEVPDFVDGVVNVAQRGRSLGLHLLLATQRPAGVVTANIRANTNLRIALRVNDPHESEDVIDAPDAARIPRTIPGRAFVRTGHSELTEFQTAYVGGRSTGHARTGTVVVEPFAFDAADGGPKAAGDPPADGDRDGATDLSGLVERIRDAAAGLGLTRPRPPWLPPLPKTVELAGFDERAASPNDPGAAGRAEIGLVDEPARQEQRPLVIDLAHDGSVLVCGTSGSGKTTLLRTIGVDLARRSAPAALNLYALDFASRGLAPLSALPQCGAVIAGDDDERVQRLFGRLDAEILRRKDLFAAAGVFSLAEYATRVGAAAAPPRIVVLLDGYAAFAAAYERVNFGALPEGLPRLVSEGRQLGIHVVVTVERRGAIPSALAAVISNRIVLRQAEADDFQALGVSTRNGRTASLPPGRGFVEDLEAQVAIVGTDGSGAGQGAAIEEVGRTLRQRHGTATAPPIEVLATEIELSRLPKPARPLVATLGVAYRTLEPIAADLDVGHLLVLGPHRSGRSTALETIVTSLADGPAPPRMELLAPRRSPLVERAGWDGLARTIDECQAAAARLVATVTAGADPGPNGLVIVVDDGEELEDTGAAADLAVVARRGRDLGIRIVGAAEIRSSHRAFSGWIPELRKEQHGLLLDPDNEIDGDLLGARLPRRGGRAYPPGRGFLVRRGEPELIQVARPGRRT